jgi:membrane associated rhomboid family serine protease
MTTWLIVVNVGVFVLQLAFARQGITEYLVLTENWMHRPWEFYRLFTCGFAHDPTSFRHIIFNMIALFFFGRAVEMRYGSRELLAIYLAGVLFSALTWNITELPIPNNEYLTPNGELVRVVPSMLGASGAIAAILLLFVLNFPHQTVYLYGVIGVPAWLLGVLFIGMDLFGAVSRHGNTAFTAHLGGALFGYLYYTNNWRLAGYLPSNWRMPRLRTGPKLKVHKPDNDSEQGEKELNRILQKISDQGQDSLTAKERKTLEQESRRYQRRRGG